MDRDLIQVERRCTLTHELIHIEQGHTRCQDAVVEWKVRKETARRLISMEGVRRHLPWALSFGELADDLWVTPLVLSDRFRSFTDKEWDIIRSLEGQGC
jgi:hypothetical protein